MLGTLNLESPSLTETELSNTLRILSSFFNKQPYHIQFCSNVDKGTASGLEYTTSQIQFITPISFLNPKLGNTFQPIMLDNINSVQKALLHRLGLTEQIYKDEILPKLLLTLDYRRLSDEDKVQIGDIVLLHCTSAQNRKFEKAILARIVRIMKSRDGANR